MKVTSNKNASEKGHISPSSLIITAIIIGIPLAVISWAGSTLFGLSFTGIGYAALGGAIVGAAGFCASAMAIIPSTEEGYIKIYRNMTNDEAAKLAQSLQVITEIYKDKMPEEEFDFLNNMMVQLKEKIVPTPENLHEIYECLSYLENKIARTDIKYKAHIKLKKTTSFISKASHIEPPLEFMYTACVGTALLCAIAGGKLGYDIGVKKESKLIEKIKAEMPQKAQPKPAATTSSATIHTVDWQALVAAQKQVTSSAERGLSSRSF